jgi:hypothetical protein
MKNSEDNEYTPDNVSGVSKKEELILIGICILSIIIGCMFLIALIFII